MNPEIISKEEFSKLLSSYDEKYYNNVSVVSDEFYESLLDIYFSRFGERWNKVGHIPKNKVKLPVWMGSMDKILKSNPKALDRWKLKNKGPYVVMEKLDGVSVLVIGEAIKVSLYTRGNGEYGTDISHIYPYLRLKDGRSISQVCLRWKMIRGELIMKQDVFKNKYSQSFSTARNLVSGLINSKDFNAEALSDICFVPFEIVADRYHVSENLSILKLLGFQDTILNRKVNPRDLEFSNLELVLYKFKKESPFQIDGLVIYDDNPHTRNITDNPSYAFAFKETAKGKLTTVLEVEWNISKHNIMKPRIRVEPIIINDVTIEWVTGFNAKFILDKKIKPGIQVEIIRSGDVIPYISSVIESEDVVTEKDLLPDCDYIWNDTGVDIICKESGDKHTIKKLVSFFQVLEIKNISEKIVEKLYNYGFTTIEQLIQMKIDDFKNIPGLGIKSGSKIICNIKAKLDTVELYELMAALPCFGIGLGKRKAKMITDRYPDIITLYKKTNRDDMIRLIRDVEGFADITAERFVKGLDPFITFIENIERIIGRSFETIVKPKSEQILDIYKGKKIVFSGFRDSELEKIIIASGGKVMSSVSKNTDLLIVKDLEEESSKISKAKELGIKIIKKC